MKNTMKMTPNAFIELMAKEARRHLEQGGCDIGDKIAWGYIENLITNYKKHNKGE